MVLAPPVKRLLTIVAGAVTASVAGWALGGLWGWALVMLAGAAFLCYLAFRRAPPRQRVSSETVDDIVGVGFVPNSALAEFVVAELRSNGIAASYRSAQPFGGANPITNPEGYCEVMVHRADAARARPFVVQRD